MEFRLSVAFVVYMILRVSAENLKMGETESRFVCHDFMQFGYLACHFSVTRSSAAGASSSLGA